MEQIRPIYQTQNDLDKEQEVADIIGNHLGKKIQKMGGNLNEIDRCVVGDNNIIEAVLEIKIRAIDYKQYPTVMISSHKILAGMPYVRYCGIPFYIAFSFNGDIHIYSVTEPEKYEYKWGGRTKQTRDSRDIEIMAHIPMEDDIIQIPKTTNNVAQPVI